mgnify:CR=1 FL=1
MRQKIYLVLLSVVCNLVTIDLAAQDDNDYSNNRKKEKSNENANNTKQETPVKVIEFIIGTWDIAAVYKNNKNITNEDTLVGLSQIRFNGENQYTAYHEGQEVDSGTFRLNENHSILYLESRDGSEPQSWDVSFENNTMTLQPGQTANAFDRSFRYVYTRRED